MFQKMVRSIRHYFFPSVPKLYTVGYGTPNWLRKRRVKVFLNNNLTRAMRDMDLMPWDLDPQENSRVIIANSAFKARRYFIRHYGHWTDWVWGW